VASSGGRFLACCPKFLERVEMFGFLRKHRVSWIIAVCVVVVVIVLVVVLEVVRSSRSSSTVKAAPVSDSTTVTLKKDQILTPENDPDDKFLSPLAVEVFSDGKITQEEVQEAEEAYASCMADNGITVGWAKPDGSGSERRPDGMTGDEATRIETSCGASSGWLIVSGTYWTLYTNPTGEDPAALTLGCLIRVGIVPEGTTQEEFEKKNSEDPNAYVPEGPDQAKIMKKWADCSSDPAHTQK
jgi:hypothetical protein